MGMEMRSGLVKYGEAFFVVITKFFGEIKTFILFFFFG